MPQEYANDVFTQKAVNFIESAVRDGQPFFVHLSTYVPHNRKRNFPAPSALRHRDLFPNARVSRKPSFNESDISDKPARMRELPPLTNSQIADLDNRQRKRLQSLRAVDEMIESLIEVLKATEQLDNTYIVFTSDNGFHLGHHRLRFGKRSPYEEDIKVPLIVRGPSVPAGQTRGHLTGNVDLAPTFVEIAGATAPDFVDGRSFLTLLKESPPAEQNWRQAFLVERITKRLRFSTRLTIPPYQALRTNDHIYVEYVTGEREMYDLREDPYELRNIITTANPTLIDELSSRIAAIQECAGTICRTVEDVQFSPSD